MSIRTMRQIGTMVALAVSFQGSAERVEPAPAPLVGVGARFDLRTSTPILVAPPSGTRRGVVDGTGVAPRSGYATLHAPVPSLRPLDGVEPAPPAGADPDRDPTNAVEGAKNATARHGAWGMPEDAPPGFIVAGRDTIFEVVLRLRIGRAVDQILLGYGHDSVLYLDAGEFADLAEFRIDDVVPDSAVVGTISPGRIPYTFDTRRGLVRRGDSTWLLRSEDAVWLDGRLYVENRFLQRVFAYESYVDWAAAQYHVLTYDHFPVVRRLARSERRSLVGSHGEGPDPSPLPTVNPFIDGGALDWSVSTPTRDPLERSTVHLGLGSQIAGGSLDLRYRRVNTSTRDYDDFRWSWLKAWPDHRAVRQVRLGDVSTTGRQGTPVTGAAVSNAPFLRPVAFANEVLAGEFPAGWEVEVYQGARLVGFDTVDVTGRFEISLPVRYGQNPVVLVGYGPNGEVVRTERTFEIPFQRLPSGQFEYGVSAGGCDTPRCRATTNVDARYGLTDRLTVQAGADYYWRDTLRNRFHPYLLASVAATRSLAFTVEGVAGGLARGRFDLTPSPDLRVTGSHTRYDTGDPAPLAGSPTERHRSEFRAFWRPPLAGERIYFEAEASRSALIGGMHRLAAATAVTYRWSGARATGGVFTEQHGFNLLPASSETGIEASLNAVLMGPFDFARTTFVRAEGRVSRERGVTRWMVGAGRQLLQPFRADLDVTWDKTFGTSLNLSLTTILRQVRAVSRNRYVPDQGITGTQDFEGSVLWNRADKRPILGNGRALGRAGLSGVVFLDANANGLLDPDEQGIENVLVRVGTDVLVTDSLGRFDVWDLVPWERTVIEVDSLSVSDPRLVATYPIGYVHPAPNSYQVINLPFTVGWQLTGPVRYSDTGAEVAGMSVLFERRETGGSGSGRALDTTRVRTFADGTFYTFGMRHGAYRVTAPDAQLVRLGAWMDEAELVLDSAVGEDLDRDFAVWVHHNPRWTINGRVRLPDAAGVLGVPVVLEHLTSPIVRREVTADDGSFVVDSLPSGAYRMFVPVSALEVLGATADTITMSLPANPAVREAVAYSTIVLRNGEAPVGGPGTGRPGDRRGAAPGPEAPTFVSLPWTIAGVVRLADDKPVGGVTVLALDVGTGRIERDVTDADGRYAMVGLRPGRYRVTVLPSDLRTVGTIEDMPVVELEATSRASVRTGIDIVVRPN